MRPLLGRATSLPGSLTKHLSNLSGFFSFRSSRLSDSREKSSSSVTSTSKNSHEAIIKPPKSYDMHRSPPPHRPLKQAHTRLGTYRSEAEGYGHGSAEDVRRNSDRRAGWLNSNRSLWVDERGQGMTLHSTFRDEEEGGMWDDSYRR